MDSDLDISDDSSQLSSRSRSRSPSQSITNSHGSQASEGEDGIPPKASKSKRRSELAAYASLLRRLETAKRSRPLAHRLLRPRGRSSRSSSSSDSSSPSREGSAELLARERNTSGPSSSHGSSTQDRFLDDTWPLNRFEILACAYYSGDDLAEVVKSIARSYIRKRGLQLSGSTPSQDFSNVADEDDIPVPTNLVNSTVELLDRALVSIAATRPCDVGRVRKGYRSINGQSVLAAAAVLAGAEEVVSATNTRVRELTRESQADDRLQHRLEVLAAAKARRSKGFTHALYGPAVPALPPPKRRHQSKAELERREAKRLAKKLKREAS